MSFNKSHSSNENETIKLLDELIVPYANNIKEKLNLPIDQKVLLLWDAFKGQNSALITSALEEYDIVPVMVPRNMTQLLQPLDLTTNGSFKKQEKKAFGEYFTNTITIELLKDPNKDATKIEVDLRLSILKQIHGNVMCQIFDIFKANEGREILKNGFQAAGITKDVKDARNGIFTDHNPY